MNTQPQALVGALDTRVPDITRAVRRAETARTFAEHTAIEVAKLSLSRADPCELRKYAKTVKASLAQTLSSRDRLHTILTTAQDLTRIRAAALALEIVEEHHQMTHCCSVYVHSILIRHARLSPRLRYAIRPP